MYEVRRWVFEDNQVSCARFKRQEMVRPETALDPAVTTGTNLDRLGLCFPLGQS